MGCGCGGGNKLLAKEQQHIVPSESKKVVSDQSKERIAQTGNCNYTVELLRGWLTKLTNLKSTQNVDLVGITYPLVNSYIGYVRSALNYTNNLCYFSKELAPIVQVIKKIDDAGL